jgi:tripartite-type tricarboxylate transporter receptor subunit TctC
MKRCVLLSALTIAACALAGTAHAQKFPERPIRIVVPFPPGGSPDANARALGKYLYASLNQPIVVDNRSGADGIIGTDHVVKSQPNGYTYLFMGHTLITNALLNEHQPFDVMRDLAPVTMFGLSDGYVIVVHPAVRATSVADLVALSKSGSRELRYGTPGVGTSQNLAGELFNTLAGAKIVHIPYRGLGAAVNALLGGDELQVGFVPMSVVAQQVVNGKLRAVANTANARWKRWPDIPTVAETIPGFAFSGGWHGMFAPAKTPPQILALMHSEVKKALAVQELRDYLQVAGYEPVGSSPEEFRQYLLADFGRWREYIRIARVDRK